VEDKQEAEEVTSTIRARHQFGDLVLKRKSPHLLSRNMQRFGFHCLIIEKNQHWKII
jgi:hypothetical protein